MPGWPLGRVSGTRSRRRKENSRSKRCLPSKIEILRPQGLEDCARVSAMTALRGSSTSFRWFSRTGTLPRDDACGGTEVTFETPESLKLILTEPLLELLVKSKV